jgi:AcrR family transcriptional regulator
MAEQSPRAEKILDVAIQILAQKGYEATSTREIVAAAGVTKPMLYYYFGSKEGVCKAGIRRLSQQFFALLQEKIALHQEAREALVEFVWTNFEFMQKHHDVGLFYRGLFFGPERRRFKEDFEVLAAEMRGLTSRLVQRVATAGIIRPGCEEDFGMALHGLIDVWHQASIIDGIELSRPLAQRIVENLLHGFGTR